MILASSASGREGHDGSGTQVTAVYRRVAHGKMALSEAAIPCLRWRFRLVKAGGYKPEAPAKAISEALRRPDNPSANRLQTALVRGLREVMDHLHQCPDMIDGGLWENSMAEVEYVTGPAASLLEDAAGLPLDFR